MTAVWRIENSSATNTEYLDSKQSGIRKAIKLDNHTNFPRIQLVNPKLNINLTNALPAAVETAEVEEYLTVVCELDREEVAGCDQGHEKYFEDGTHPGEGSECAKAGEDGPPPQLWGVI